MLWLLVAEQITIHIEMKDYKNIVVMIHDSRQPKTMSLTKLNIVSCISLCCIMENNEISCLWLLKNFIDVLKSTTILLESVYLSKILESL